MQTTKNKTDLTKQESDLMPVDKSRSWFLTLNNPEEYGYVGTPKEICEKLRDEWIKDNLERSGAWVYCVSAEGLKHVHIVLEEKESTPVSFAHIKKNYAVSAQPHIEPTMGKKKQVEDYIYKRGDFAEKGEIIVTTVTHGDIVGRQGSRSDLTLFRDLIESGMTPVEIYRNDPNTRRYKQYIQDMYFDFNVQQQEKKTIRDVKVYWHFGETGTGKTYTRYLLEQEKGAENVYCCNSSSNGMFDGYNSEPIIWIDEFRGEIPYRDLLKYFDVYRLTIPCRYSDKIACWTEVHITSVLTPQQCYLSRSEDSIDNIDQLLRRLTDKHDGIIYHFKDGNCYYTLTLEKEELYNDLYARARMYVSANQVILTDDDIPY